MHAVILDFIQLKKSKTKPSTLFDFSNFEYLPELRDKVSSIMKVAPNSTKERVCGTHDFPEPVDWTRNVTSQCDSLVKIFKVRGMTTFWYTRGSFDHTWCIVSSVIDKHSIDNAMWKILVRNIVVCIERWATFVDPTAMDICNGHWNAKHKPLLNSGSTTFRVKILILIWYSSIHTSYCVGG